LYFFGYCEVEAVSSSSSSRGKVESFLRMGHKRQQPENMEIYLAGNLVVQCILAYDHRTPGVEQKKRRTILSCRMKSAAALGTAFTDVKMLKC